MNPYPRLTKLAVTIHPNPDHVLCVDLKARLSELDSKRFDELFGVQTGHVTNKGETALFASDAEAVLERMASGKRTGSQLIWD